jgi:hypothetical protein
MNPKTGGGQSSTMSDRRGVVSSGRGRVESDNDDMDESGLSDDEDEQVC